MLTTRVVTTLIRHIFAISHIKENTKEKYLFQEKADNKSGDKPDKTYLRNISNIYICNVYT